MTGLDTNVLVRYFAQDHPEQSLRATRLIESFSTQEQGFVPLVTMTELVWVLRSSYNTTKEDTIAILDDLLHAIGIVVENAAVVAQAIRVYAESNADFADCLIERSAHSAHCTHTVTLDEKAAKTAGMVLLDS